MRKGIISGGSWIVDHLKFVDRYPSIGNITTIQGESIAGGGSSHNVLGDLAGLDVGIPLFAAGCIGADGDGDFIMREIRQNNIDYTNMYCIEGVRTSYTDVMIPSDGSSRTFFHSHGANAEFGLEHIEKIDAAAKIFHLGYLLLLDKMEVEDSEYGIGTARVLDAISKKGYKTSVDVVSEEGDRFRELVLPCLPYIDYLIINEVEAGECSGRSLRDGNGEILIGEVAAAAQFLIEHGVREVCVVHFPEGGFRLDSDGSHHFEPSIPVPPSEIVSPVGAGDAFCAGMLYALHEGKSLNDSLIIANTSARFNLSHASSCGGAPTLKQIEKFITDNYK